jgi:hypothetical protein
MFFLYWTKDLIETLNLIINLTLNFYLLYIDFNMVDFNLTIKDDIHGLAAKLWFDNEQDINTLDI